MEQNEKGLLCASVITLILGVIKELFIIIILAEVAISIGTVYYRLSEEIAPTPARINSLWEWLRYAFG